MIKYIHFTNNFANLGITKGRITENLARSIGQEPDPDFGLEVSAQQAESQARRDLERQEAAI